LAWFLIKIRSETFLHHFFSPKRHRRQQPRIRKEPRGKATSDWVIYDTGESNFFSALKKRSWANCLTLDSSCQSNFSKKKKQANQL